MLIHQHTLLAYVSPSLRYYCKAIKLIKSSSPRCEADTMIGLQDLSPPDIEINCIVSAVDDDDQHTIK